MHIKPLNHTIACTFIWTVRMHSARHERCVTGRWHTDTLDHHPFSAFATNAQEGPSSFVLPPRGGRHVGFRYHRMHFWATTSNHQGPECECAHMRQPFRKISAKTRTRTSEAFGVIPARGNARLKKYLHSPSAKSLKRKEESLSADNAQRGIKQ